MSEVFILGAGFSKAVNTSMPLLDELSTEISQRLGGLPEYLLALGNNVEAWLTYLAQPQPWLMEEHNLQNRALFLRMIAKVVEILDNRTDDTLQREPPEWVRRLVDYWHTSRATVITLNYDTLVERIPERGVEYILPMRIQSLWPPRWIVEGQFAGQSFKLLKLHGSVNWYNSGAAPSYGEAIYHYIVARWAQPRDEEGKSRLSLAALTPLIIPPTAEKSTYFQHVEIRRIWRQAALALQSATRIFCIGYSLPVTDLGNQFFFHYGRPEQKTPLFVVNKDDAAGKHYRALLGDSYDVDNRYAGENCVATMVKALTHS